MNWVDLVIFFITIFFAIEGQRRGFFAQVIDIIGFLSALLVSLVFYQQAGDLLVKYFNLPKIAANPVGFLLVWLLIETLFFIIFGGFFKKITYKLQNISINKFLGFIPATLNSLLFLSFILLFVVSIPIRPDIKKDIFDSKVGSYLVNTATILEGPLSGVFGPITKQGLTFLTVRQNQTGSIPLEFTQSNVFVDIQGEKEMLEMVNKERIRLGIKSLEWDKKLAEVARLHSEDMFKRGYFSHFSPEGQDVGTRLEELKIKYIYAGENLALAPTVERAHIGLMNSQGHKRNILDPAFKKVGIGVIDGDIYGKMFTQVFSD